MLPASGANVRPIAPVRSWKEKAIDTPPRRSLGAAHTRAGSALPSERPPLSVSRTRNRNLCTGVHGMYVVVEPVSRCAARNARRSLCHHAVVPDPMAAAPHATAPSPSRRNAIVWILLLIALYVGTALAGFNALAWGARFPISLIPVGLAVGAIFRYGLRGWPVLAMASAVVVWGLHGTWQQALVQAAAMTCSVVLNVLTLRVSGFDAQFERPKNVGTFVLAAAVGALGATAIWTVGWWLERGSVAVAPMTSRWLLASFNSVLVIAPLVIVADRAAWRIRAATGREIAAWLVSGILVTALIFGLPPAYIGVPLFGVCLVLLAWALVRLSLAYALVGSIMFGLAATLSAAFDVGVLGGEPTWLAQRLSWNVQSLLALWVLGVNAFIATSERSERRYRALFDQSPAPKWLTDPDTRRFIAVNDAAVSTYGYSKDEFAALTVDDVVVAAGAGDEPQLHQHRAGHALRVEGRVRELDLEEGRALLWFNVDVTERLRLRSELQRVRSDERAHLSRDIHDGLGQELTAISMFAAALAGRLRTVDPDLQRDAERIRTLTIGALESARRVARGLSPLATGETLADGLRRITAGLKADQRPVTTLEIASDAQALPATRFAAEGLFRICQEALANAWRHGDAGTVVIRVARESGSLVVSVSDDGRGFDRRAGNGGLGLETLGLRAEEIGAVLQVISAPGRGTRVECRYSLVNERTPSASGLRDGADRRALATVPPMAAASQKA
jgi:PAS domain S-box-containing protein